MKKNVDGQKIGAQMLNSGAGTAFTSVVTVYVCGDAGAQAIGATASGSCTLEGNGFYTYGPTQAETNYNHIAFTFTGTSAIPVTIQVYTNFPQTADAPTATANADALLNRDMSAVSDTNARSPLNALRFLRNKWSIATNTLTVTKEDDSTQAWTATLVTSAGASPVISSDPG